jgi:hypothetical protein
MSSGTITESLMLERLVLAGVLGITCAASLRGQSVTGHVIDSATGEPVAQQWVEVRPLRGGRWAGTRTDSSGSFSFAATPASDYRVEISLPDGTKAVRDSLALADFAHPLAVAFSEAERQHMYWEFQVDRQPVLIESQPLEYPHGSSAVGEVLVQYAVDSTGRPVLETFKVLRTPDRLLSDAVQQAVASFRFEPARKAGRPVRQLVQQPFVFHR